jgi:hypothetical protein
MFNKTKILNTIEYPLYLYEKLTKSPNLENGLIERKPNFKKDWEHKEGTFGLVDKYHLILNDRFDLFASTHEKQKRGRRETMACVTFSYCNAIEKIVNCMKFLVDNNFPKEAEVKGEKVIFADFDEDQKEEIRGIVNVFKMFGLINDKGECDVSDRFIAKLSGTTNRGNSQNKVAETVRKVGLIPEAMWQFDEANYYANIPQELIDAGEKFAEYIEINHEWVNPIYFKQTRKYGDIQTSIHAPSPTKNGIYQVTRLRRNHAVTQPREAGAYKLVQDTYDPFNKKFVKNYPFGWGKLPTIHLKKKFTLYNTDQINNYKKRGWNYVVLVEKCDKYEKGVYKLENDKFVYVPQKNAVDNWVLDLKEGGKVEGINAKNFKKMLNI